jgi:hypothetical protein
LKQIILFSCLFVVAACATAQPKALPTQSEVATAPTEFLLTASAADFQKSSLGSVRVRNVRLGYLPTPIGETQYLICGEFESGTDGMKSNWVPFTTIKTSGYEQILGSIAESLCQRSVITWLPIPDLAAALQTQLGKQE